MIPKKHSLIILSVGVFLFLLDRFFKYQALNAWTVSHLFKDSIGWSVFFNTGIAFSLPLPSWITAIVTAPILMVVGWVIVRLLRSQSPLPTYLPVPLPHNQTFNLLITTLLFSGALSNLIDRLVYGYVVDYFRIFTGIINIADVVIALGFALYLLGIRHDHHTVDQR
jgi:signal peptidase II